MKCCYVAIEKNIETFETYKILWAGHNIEGIRADTMTEGIEQAIKIEKSSGKELYFVSIVADEIDFMPQLKTLSEKIKAPILIAVSKANYDEKEHHEALKNGADFYATNCNKAQQDIVGVLSAISSINRREKKCKTPNQIITHGDILLDVSQHKAFFKDKEVSLTATEMKILHYMMVNRGLILGHEQILQNAYDDYDGKTNDCLYSAIKRLRKKIRNASETDYIETVRDVGYRFSNK
jgi:DNA-binding response OmpR family regulator